MSLAEAAAAAAATPGESLRYDEPKSGQVLRLPMASFPQTEPPCYQPTDTVGSLLFRGLPANRKSKGMPVLLVGYKTETCFRFVGVYSHLQSPFSTREKMNVFTFFLFPLECGRHGTGSANIGASHMSRQRKDVCNFLFSHLFSSSHMWGRHWCNL